jgi:hypothetical protein
MGSKKTGYRQSNCEQATVSIDEASMQLPISGDEPEFGKAKLRQIINYS